MLLDIEYSMPALIKSSFDFLYEVLSKYLIYTIYGEPRTPAANEFAGVSCWWLSDGISGVLITPMQLGIWLPLVPGSHGPGLLLEFSACVLVPLASMLPF